MVKGGLNGEGGGMRGCQTNNGPSASSSSVSSGLHGHHGTQLNYKKVFIQRDYSQGTAVRFQRQLPQDLEGHLERELFEHFIDTLNSIYLEAEKMNYRTCCESCLACLTAYLIYWCMETYYEKCLKRAAAFISDQNDTVFKRRGIIVTDPIERGLRVIEFTIFLTEQPQQPQPQQQQPQSQLMARPSTTGSTIDRRT